MFSVASPAFVYIMGLLIAPLFCVIYLLFCIFLSRQLARLLTFLRNSTAAPYWQGNKVDKVTKISTQIDAYGEKLRNYMPISPNLAQ